MAAVLAAVLSGLVATVFFLPWDSDLLDDHGRFEVWENVLTWKTGFMDILIGQGPGFMADMYNKTFTMPVNENFTIIHNEFIELYFTFGVVGVVCAVWVFQKAIRKITDPVLIGILAGLLGSSVTFFPFHISTLSCVAAVTYALAVRSQETGDCLN